MSTICFAHVAYQLAAEFRARGRNDRVLAVTDAAGLDAAIGEAEILCLSGLWRPELLAKAPSLRLIQATSAGTDQFDAKALAQRGVRLCSARGVNAEAVAEHALALMLAAVRKLPAARDRQHRKAWQGMMPDRRAREGQLRGGTLLVVGMGTIGSRVAELGHAFGMEVIGVKRQAAPPPPFARQVASFDDLPNLLPTADFVCLTCALTPQTRRIIDAAALAAMRPDAWLVNVARGQVVDEPALVSALQQGRIAGAALDCFEQEPLPPESPLWSMPNVIVTAHAGGETGRYETDLVDLLLDNLARLEADRPLRNEITPPR